MTLPLPSPRNRTVALHLSDELAVVEAKAKADRADAELWSTVSELVRQRRATRAQIAALLGTTERTVSRRVAGSRAGEAGHV